MALLQKLINILVIVGCTSLLLYLNTTIDKISSEQDEIIQLTSLIGNGVVLSDDQSTKITNIMEKYKNIEINNSLCFLKAYDEIIIKGKLNAQTVFNIFEQGKQFSGISTCTHYYSLLIYRTSLLQNKEKVRIENILNNLLNQSLKNKIQTPICIYFYAYNTQITVKEQLAQIISQDYNNFTTIVDTDATTDNTRMFVKYTIEENKEKINKFQINTETERKGFINNFKRNVQNQCQDNSIVLVLDKSSTLLSQNSLAILNHFFTTVTTDIAVFKSLTIRHENIENNHLSSFPQTYPVLAFKKSGLNKIDSFIQKISQKSQKGSAIMDFQQELMTLHLMKDLKQKEEISYANEAIIYRQDRSTTEQTALTTLFLQQ